MNCISKFVLTFFFFCSTFSLHPFLKAARASKEAMKLIVLDQPIVQQSNQKIAHGAQAIRNYKQSIAESYYQAKEINQALQVAMSQNAGKFVFGGMLFSGLITAGYFSQQDNPYAVQLKEEFIKAVDADNANLIVIFDAILREESILQEAALKHALINSDKVFKTKNHLETFKTLLERSPKPADLIVNVIKSGDINKVHLMLNVGVSVEKMLPEAIKVKNVEITKALLISADHNLDEDDAFVKAKLLCDRTLLKRLFFDNRIAALLKKSKNIQNPISLWLNNARKNSNVPEPIIL